MKWQEYFLLAVAVYSLVWLPPMTGLARTAVQEGVLEDTDSLLNPRFYVAEGLEGWIEEEVASWLEDRPHWMT